MQRAIAHRGPDDRGIWQSARGHAAFAHTRLAISICRRPAISRCRSTDGRLTITFNGEIYNFVELRRELERRGVTFPLAQRHRGHPARLRRVRPTLSSSGCAACSRSRSGTSRAQRCLLARDRFGIKPLYYHDSGTRLMFASEVRALLQSGLVPRRSMPRAAYEYFRAGSVPEPRTLLQGVQCLEAGTA